MKNGFKIKSHKLNRHSQWYNSPKIVNFRLSTPSFPSSSPKKEKPVMLISSSRKRSLPKSKALRCRP